MSPVRIWKSVIKCIGNIQRTQYRFFNMITCIYDRLYEYEELILKTRMSKLTRTEFWLQNKAE